MGYSEALEAAGAKIVKSQHFGSYHGDALYLVEFQGKTGWLVISYGSCSGCDAFEAEFGYEDRNDPKKLADFGAEYLDEILTTKAVIKRFKKQASWDSDAGDIIKYVKENG